jgi:hypothetical protein
VNAKDIVILVCEKKAPAPHWTHTRGIYADLSEWPRTIDYYVKCPECGNVHGFYKSMADARSKRLCPTCDYDHTEKLKKEVAKVNEALPPESFDPDVPVDAKSELNRYVAGDWVALAKWELERELGEELVFDPDYYANRELNYDEPETFTALTFSVPGTDLHYTVWKTEDDAIADATRDLQNSFEDETDIYIDWLKNYVDMNKVKEALKPDEENMTRERFEEDNPGYEEQVKAMVDAGKLDEEMFYKLNGDIKKETPARQKLLAQAVDEWVEQTVDDRLEDPEEYLKEMGYDDTGGKNPYTGEKIETLSGMLQRLGGLDYERAAKDAISADGWQQSRSRYDGRSINLPSGSVAVRE